MRPHEISKEAKFILDKEGDVKQGAFGESSFIGGIVIIATRGDFLEKLFLDYEHFELGFVSFQFFKNGEWKQVIVDTLLPFDPDSKQICFSQCANPSGIFTL
jgi:calpain